MEDDGLEILRAMRMGVSYYFTISLRAFTIRMRPLSQSEFLKVTADVQAIIRSSPKDYQNRIAEEIETAKVIIIQASTSDIGKHDPQITDEVLKHFTIHELLALYKQYNAKVEELDPAIETLTDDQVRDYVESLKKKLVSLSDLSISQLKAVTTFLLTREELPKDK